GAFRNPQLHGVSRYLVRHAGAPVCRNRRVGAAGKAEKQRCRVLYLCFPSQGIYARVGLRDPATEVHQQVETVAAKVHQRSAPAPGFVPAPLAGAGWGVTREVDARRDYLPDSTQPEPLPYLAMPCIEALVVADHQTDPAPFGRFDHGACLGAG